MNTLYEHLVICVRTVWGWKVTLQNKWNFFITFLIYIYSIVSQFSFDLFLIYKLYIYFEKLLNFFFFFFWKTWRKINTYFNQINHFYVHVIITNK